MKHWQRNVIARRNDVAICIIEEKYFYVPICSAAMMLPLRRTLVLHNIIEQ